MRRRGILLLTVLALMVTALPATAAIHEIVAAYCSGGDVGVIAVDGELRPPPIVDMTLDRTFAKPVSVNGAVDFPNIGSSPSAKFTEGTNIFALDLENPDHESGNCANLQP